MNINDIKFSDDVYAGDPYFTLISSKEFKSTKPVIQKLTYEDNHSICWKIGQVALAIFLSIITLGAIMCTSKGKPLWTSALDRFKLITIYVRKKIDLPQTALNQVQRPLSVSNPPKKTSLQTQPPSNPVKQQPQPVLNPPKKTSQKTQLTPPAPAVNHATKANLPKNPPPGLSKPLKTPTAAPTPSISQLPVKPLSALDLKAKYKDIFSKYVLNPQGQLLLKENNEKTELTESSLLNVLEAADQISEEPDVINDGRVIKVDTEQYIIKADPKPSPGSQLRPLHIIRVSSAHSLQSGAHGIVKKVLVVSSGCFGVLKYINLNADDPVEERAYVMNEVTMLPFVHQQGYYEGFQDPPIATLNISNTNESYVGYVGRFYSKGNLLSQLQNTTFAERLELATELITHATELWKRGVWHTDYKLENILVEERIPSATKSGSQKSKLALRIADFGLAGKFSGRPKNQKEGWEIYRGSNYSTQDLQAMEYLKKYVKDKNYDAELLAYGNKKDVIGVGSSVYALLAKTYAQPTHPWETPFPSKPLEDAGCSKELTKLILKTIELNPNDRLPLEEFKPRWEAITGLTHTV